MLVLSRKPGEKIRIGQAGEMRQSGDDSRGVDFACAVGAALLLLISCGGRYRDAILVLQSVEVETQKTTA